jgi:uncharacterized protein (TIGR02001 family)
MKKSLIALALVGAFAAPAFAEEAAAPTPEHTFTGNVGFVSNYVFRGISQTQNKPALQGGFDYSHSSGVYVGTWASNVNWVRDTGFKTENSLEWDIYGGYKGSFLEDFTYDVGVLTYYYPGTRIENTNNTNSTEVYAGLGWKFVSFKYSYAVSPYLFGWQGPNGEKTRGSQYFDLTANYTIGESGWAVLGHVGRQLIQDRSTASYTDWKLGVTKDLGVGVVGLAYTGTNAKTCGDTVPDYCWNSKDVAKGIVALSFNKTF